jgi:hypothetical protein
VLQRDDLADEAGAFVLVLMDRMDERVSLALARAGVGVLDALPHNAFIVDLRGASMRALRESGVCSSLHRYEDAWKIDPSLLPGAAQPAWSDPGRIERGSRGGALLIVTLFRGRDCADTITQIGAQPGWNITSIERMTGGWVLGVQAPLDGASHLAQLPDVAYIEHAPEYSLRSNISTRWVIQSNTQNSDSIHARGITGAGQIGGLIDGGLAEQHCSFLDSVNPVGPLHRKILAYNSAFVYSPHGTHVGCTFVGNDSTLGNGRGHAPDARVVFNTFPSFGETNVYNRFDLHRTQGAFVHNNSWGSDSFSTYESTCRAVDSFSYDHEDNLLVFAVSDSATLHIPEVSKSALAVASTNAAISQHQICTLNTGGPAGGPTFDGRIKPDVVAPGCGILSATGQTGCSFVGSSGSSMSAPAAAGLAILVREYFERGFYPGGVANPGDGFVPSGALMRAVLVNGAVDVIGQSGFPSDREGWGRVLGDNALFFSGESRSLVVRDETRSSADALQTGHVREFSVPVLAGQPLKVTLAYTDFPGAIASSFPVVNNLDLEVRGPTGNLYLGNAWSAGQSQSGGSPDPVNTIEQVYLLAPAPGNYVIRVLGTQVNMGPQGYALAITGALGPVPQCDPIDFNRDGLFPDVLDVDDFISAWMGGPCSNDPSCGDLDFNNDGLSPDLLDIDSFLSVFAGGACL